MTKEYRSIDWHIASTIYAALRKAGINATIQKDVMKGSDNVHRLTIPDGEMARAQPIIDLQKSMISYAD